MELEDLHWEEFEELIASLWESFGYDTEITSSGRDGGIDVIATKNDPYSEKVLIQAKHHSKRNKIGVQAVREYSSLLHQPDVDIVVIATSGQFTSEAKKQAEKLGVKLINREYIENKINTISCDLLNKYSDTDVSTGGHINDTFEVESLSEMEASPSVKEHVKKYWTNLSDKYDQINFLPLEENIDFRPNHGEHQRYQYAYDGHHISFRGPIGNGGIIVDKNRIEKICDEFDLEIMEDSENWIIAGAYGDRGWKEPTDKIDINSEATIVTAFLKEIYGTAEELEVQVELSQE